MELRRFTVHLMAVTGLMAGPAAASEPTYPTKPLRIVTCEAGGGSDLVSRLIAQGIAGGLGQPAIVENRPCGVIPGDIVSVASPDGYTTLLSGSPLWMSPLLQSNVRYDPIKDFLPITLVAVSPTVLAVYPGLPAKSVKELIALAKAKPGELNYAAAAIGSPNHIAGELLKAMAGVNIVAVPYKGSGPSLNALIAGQVQLAFAAAAAVMPHVKSGRLTGLAVCSLQPSALAPSLPTLATTVPGYESGSIYGMFAPARTPGPIIGRLNTETVRFLNRPEVKEKFLSAGLEVVAGVPEQLGTTVKSEMTRLGKVIKDAGIRAE